MSLVPVEVLTASSRVLLRLWRGNMSVVPKSMDIRISTEQLVEVAAAGPAGKQVSLRAMPSQDVLGVLRSLVLRSRRRSGVQLPELFVRRTDQSDGAPPLTLLLRGGQGGEVRLKLYLTMLMLAVHPPFDIKEPVPARSWAAALGIPDPENRGARRVGDAITWLAEHKFLETERRQGAPGAVRLLHADLSGRPYVRPTQRERYITLPLGLWEQGWIARLSGTALALLIVLLDMQSARTEPQWISPAQARRRYDLSPDTWSKALKELTAFDLVTILRRPQGREFNHQRMRNAYWVRTDSLHRVNAPANQGEKEGDTEGPAVTDHQLAP